MNNTASRSPAHAALCTQFAAALESGDTLTAVDTPKYAEPQHPLGYVLGDYIGGGILPVLVSLVRVLSVGMKSTDPATRLECMAAAAVIATLHADVHEQAAGQAAANGGAE